MGLAIEVWVQDQTMRARLLVDGERVGQELDFAEPANAAWWLGKFSLPTMNFDGPAEQHVGPLTIEEWAQKNVPGWRR